MELDSSKKNYNKMMVSISERIMEHNKNLRKFDLENEINVISNVAPTHSYTSESEERRVKSLLQATLKKGEKLPEKILNVSEMLYANKVQEESNPEWYNVWIKLKTLTKRSRIIKYAKEQSLLKSFDKNKGLYLKTLLLSYFENCGFNVNTFEYDIDTEKISDIKTLIYENGFPIIHNFDGGQKMVDALATLNDSSNKEPKEQNKVKRINKKKLVEGDKINLKNKKNQILTQEID
jgi:hypothetical protein